MMILTSHTTTWGMLTEPTRKGGGIRRSHMRLIYQPLFEVICFSIFLLTAVLRLGEGEGHLRPILVKPLRSGAPHTACWAVRSCTYSSTTLHLLSLRYWQEPQWVSSTTHHHAS